MQFSSYGEVCGEVKVLSSIVVETRELQDAFVFFKK